MSLESFRAGSKPPNVEELAQHWITGSPKGAPVRFEKMTPASTPCANTGPVRQCISVPRDISEAKTGWHFRWCSLQGRPQSSLKLFDRGALFDLTQQGNGGQPGGHWRPRYVLKLFDKYSLILRYFYHHSASLTHICCAWMIIATST